MEQYEIEMANRLRELLEQAETALEEKEDV
jgi:hypothetical protein